MFTYDKHFGGRCSSIALTFRTSDDPNENKQPCKEIGSQAKQISIAHITEHAFKIIHHGNPTNA